MEGRDVFTMKKKEDQEKEAMEKKEKGEMKEKKKEKLKEKLKGEKQKEDAPEDYPYKNPPSTWGVWKKICACLPLCLIHHRPESERKKGGGDKKGETAATKSAGSGGGDKKGEKAEKAATKPSGPFMIGCLFTCISWTGWCRPTWRNYHFTCIRWPKCCCCNFLWCCCLRCCCRQEYFTDEGTITRDKTLEGDPRKAQTK